MANLERILFVPKRDFIENGVLTWQRDQMLHSVEALPQLYWQDGSSWAEVNQWAKIKSYDANGGDTGTVFSLMKHLADYANWLEQGNFDWRHFPERFAERVLVKYRKELIAQRERDSISPSTATARMAATIQFYRYAASQGLVGRESPLWKDEDVVIRYHDAAGFARSITRAKSELSISNRRRPGLTLEDGLTPLAAEHAQKLLRFTATEALTELHLMLSSGFLTGARIGSIATLSVHNIEAATQDFQMPGFYRIAVGPGTGVSTKFDVTGELLLPDFLLNALATYAYSMRRLKRQALASKEHRSRLFLTVRGNPYQPQSFNRLMTDLRRRAVTSGLHFMKRFKFHQTRSTYGTWLMELAMRVAKPAAAIAFVRDSMLHKDESTTLRYVRFNERSGIKAEISNEFSSAFSGLVNRDWSRFEA